MTKRLARLFQLGALLLLAACDSSQVTAAETAVVDAPMAPHYAPYNTQLFNLLERRKSIIDGKMHYDAALDKSLDALLAQSSHARTSKASGPTLKKRLLSGPASTPRAITTKAGGKAYLYYTACQAHACNLTRLALLYQPDAKTMVAKLTVDGSSEYLGNPDDSEVALLSALTTDRAAAKP